MTVGTLAGAAGFGLEKALALEEAQGAAAAGGFQHHVAAGAAVTAVGPAPGLVARPVKTDAASPAVATPDGDLYLIGKGLQDWG